MSGSNPVAASSRPRDEAGLCRPQSSQGGELKPADELRAENEALRDRLSRLSESSLRISESLDVTTVLREVVESTRTLTSAGCSGITTMDASGHLQDFVTAGVSPEEYQRFLHLPHGPGLWEYLRAIPQPLRLRDLAAHLGPLGFPDDPTLARSFLGTPIRHRGGQVGNFYLADKAGGQEFTREDEEVLALFASQAGAAIANARRHRAEQRARADLEALVDTSPVGVVVFDARTGHPVSLNREAKRIVGGLGLPGRSAEQLLEVLSWRRADGRELSMATSPLPEALRSATTVRAEEIVLSVPDGRRVTTLVNATPIQAEDGAVVSVVVTMQDLAPLEELERLRAEFLSLVSHELRAPLAAIKGSAATVLGGAPAPDPAEMLQFFRIINEQADHMRGLISDLLDAGHIEAGTLSVTPEPADVADLVEQARKTFLSGGGRHTVQIDLPPDLPRVRADRRRLVQVLNNLLANASTYSPASCPIRVAAVRDGVHVAVSVSDEGQGVPADRLPHLFRKFSRIDGEARGRGIEGSGLGLSICKGLVEAHGGRIWADSDGADRGTRVTFTMPVADDAVSGAAAGPARAAGDSRGTGRERTCILVVDDDPETLRYVRDTLTDAGYAPQVTGDPEDVPRLIKTTKPALVLLDLVLPGTDGIALMARVPELADLPVIFISGYGRDQTIAQALEAGAADYVVKPFSPTELVARIQAALRGRATPPEPYRLGDLAIDYEERRVTVAGRPVPLTVTEYDLLRELSVNAGRVLTHEYLLRRVWGPQHSGDARLVRAFVKKLRRKLGDAAASPAYIVTEPRVGYRMTKAVSREGSTG